MLMRRVSTLVHFYGFDIGKVSTQEDLLHNLLLV